MIRRIFASCLLLIFTITMGCAPAKRPVDDVQRQDDRGGDPARGSATDDDWEARRDIDRKGSQTR